MKLLTVLSTTALAVLLGISVSAFAQDEAHPQEDKRAEPDAKAAQQEKQEEKQTDKDKQIDKDKAEKQVDKDKENKQAVQEKSAARQDERQDQRADAKQGGRIPEDRFRANFGRAHTFSIGHPVIVAGTPRFQYGGYWFVIAQPWPVGWAYTDVVYVDFIDGGYYLLSPVHPGIQISINVIL